MGAVVIRLPAVFNPPTTHPAAFEGYQRPHPIGMFTRAVNLLYTIKNIANQAVWASDDTPSDATV